MQAFPILHIYFILDFLLIRQLPTTCAMIKESRCDRSKICNSWVLLHSMFCRAGLFSRLSMESMLLFRCITRSLFCRQYYRLMVFSYPLVNNGQQWISINGGPNAVVASKIVVKGNEASES